MHHPLMHIRSSAALLLALTACPSTPPMFAASEVSTGEDETTTGTTTNCPIGQEGCACTPGGGCDPGLVCPYFKICEPAAGDTSTTGGEETSSSGTSGESASSTTTWVSTSSSSGDGETGSSSSTTAPAPFCGDGELDDGEDCDDGNNQPGDGCDAVCAWEPWQHEGVAHNVPVADLVGWELCWSGDYGAGDSVGYVTIACDGDHLMMACRPTGAAVLTVVAHAPREDVLWPVDYGGGERRLANGVNWYWAPDWNIEGFSPGDDPGGCDPNGDGIQPGHVCWLNADDDPLTFQVGARCGVNDINANESGEWERLLFHTVR